MSYRNELIRQGEAALFTLTARCEACQNTLLMRSNVPMVVFNSWSAGETVAKMKVRVSRRSCFSADNPSVS